MSQRLTLLFTNDLHGRLTAAGADRLAALKATHAPCLLLDAGDAVRAGNLGCSLRGEAMHRLMNRAGYDAGALGNREFHPLAWAQQRKLSAATFAMLCTNLRRADGRALPAPLRATATFELAGLRVLCFGLCVPMIPAGHWAERISPFRFAQPAEAVPEAAADLVICLSHLGLEADRRLAAERPGIDLILGGHSHTPLAAPQRIGSTWLFQNAPHGAEVTRIEVDLGAGRPHAVQAERLPLVER